MNDTMECRGVRLQRWANRIELRLAQYDAVPELREQDAANALIWSTWGGRLLVLLERLSRELGLEEPPG